MAEQLKVQDLYVLAKFDEETGKIDLQNRMIVQDPESINRLIEAGLISSNGAITETGLTQARKTKKTLEVLKKGIPIERRTKKDENKILSFNHLWMSGEYLKKKYYTNGQIIMVGLPVKTMNCVRADGEARKAIAQSIKSSLAGSNWVEVKPHTWSMPEPGGLEIIWLVNKSTSTMIPVQSAYVDYIQHRYPTVSFFADGKKSGRPVQARVKNQGWSDVIGLFMPIRDNEGILSTPNIKEE